MKRVISLALTMILLVVCLAVPVMADEPVDGNWFNVLDYGYPSGYTSNYISLDTNKNYRISYSTPLTSIYSVDLIFRTDSSDFQLGTSSHYLTVVSLGSGYYRAYGYQLTNGREAYFYFEHKGSGSYLEILSYKVCSVPFDSDPLSFYGHVYDYSYTPIKTTDFSGIGSSPLDPISISPNASREEFEGFVSRVYLESWNAYDYISLDIALWSSSFSSVKVQLDGLPVPYHINTIESSDVLGVSLVLLNVLIDLREVDRDSSSYISFDVSGMVNPTFTGSFTVRSCLGYVSVPSPSLWTHWFTNLQGWLSSGFSSVTSSLSTLGTDISNLTSNLSSWISNQTTAILGGFSNLEAHITGRFKVLGSWLSSYFSEQTSFLTNSISSWGQNISSTITSGVDRIVSALSPNGSANDFNDKVQQQGSELENMAGAMNAVTRPDVSTAIPDIGGFLTVSGPVTLAAVFDPFWKNSYILRLLLGSLAVSVAFTVVYGGKK